MKRIVIALFLFAALAADLSAQANPLVIYAEGKADVQDVKGRRRKAETGAYVFVDETLITGRGGRIQLQSKDGVFDVRENTVLKLMQAQTKGKKQNAYMVALGRVNVKVGKLAAGDPGPRLGSSTAAAGIRGTELDVFGGADGSSLILVTEGAVDVESQGATVSLNPNEAVEVKPGQAPGEKFTVQRPIDYRAWNEGKFEEFLKNPKAGIQAIQTELQTYITDIERLYSEYESYQTKIKNEETKLKTIEEEKGEEETKKYYVEQIMPLNVESTMVYMNIRFDALSALSLRRYVAGRLYFLMRMQYINNTNETIYLDFMAEYQKTLALFSEGIYSFIVEADI